MRQHDDDHFTIDITQDGGRITVAGELDVATSSTLHSTLESLHIESDQPVQIDLSGITFCDSTGLGTLIWADNTYARPAGHAILVNPSTHLQRMITLTGLDGHLPIADI